MSWFRLDGVDTIISVHAQPGAKRTEVQGLHGDALKIRVAAPPVEGQANAELQRFLAKAFAVRQRDVSLCSGELSRGKQFRITGTTVDPHTLLAKP